MKESGGRKDVGGRGIILEWVQEYFEPISNIINGDRV